MMYLLVTADKRRPGTGLLLQIAENIIPAGLCQRCRSGTRLRSLCGLRQSCPGPVAGAGLGYLALAGGYYVFRRWRRRKTEE